MTCTRRSPALLLDGDISTAQAATLFLFDRQQQADGSMPRNSLLNGQPAPDTGGLQLDETSYPILMDWQSGLALDSTLYQQHVVPAADFLVAHGPSDGSRALGGAVRLFALDDRGRDRRADGGRPHRTAQQRPDPGRGLSGDRRRLRAQHRGVDGHDDRSVHRLAASRPTSSGSPSTPTRTPPIRSTSATAASRSISAR